MSAESAWQNGRAIFHEVLEGRRLQMLTAVERAGGPDESPLEQPVPRFVSLELTSPAGSPPVRWGVVSGYPAPCFGLDASGWSGNTR